MDPQIFSKGYENAAGVNLFYHSTALNRVEETRGEIKRMNFDAESMLKELTGLESTKFPEMSIQTMLELVTITEYTHLKEKTRKLSGDQLYMLTYEMGLFEEDELSVLENEYKNYLGLDKIEKHLRMALS